MKTGLSKKPVRIHLLNNDSVVLVFETKSTVRQLFEQVCTLLSIKEKHFFGLSTVVDNEKWFMDLKYKISKYAPKEWGKEIKRRASDLAVSSAAVLTVQFQVQFYVEHPKLISDPISRHLYYLQLKKNVARSKVLTQDEILFTIASHALQTDLGDHNTVHHKGHYFRPEDYFPSWFIEKWGREYLLSHLPTLHAEHKGRSSFESQALYIQQASGIDDVPVHYYKLYKNKKETKSSVLLGIFHQGIRIHYGNPEKMQQTPWKLEFEFMWNKVGRLFFTGKRFEIYPEDLPACRKLTYYTGSHSRSKYLLHFLRETHSLYMSLSPYAQQMRKVDGKKSESEAARRYRESYIAGKNLESADTTSNEHHSTDNEDEIKSKQQGREKSYYRSMTSHGSSHTSGIESDSKQRTEEEDDEDNYADDFDPIAHDHAREEIIDITEDHLTAPPSKSLSVNNLADPNLTEMKIKPLHNSVLDVKRTGRPSRGNTLTGDDFCIVPDVSLICENNNPDLKTPKHLSVSSENRDDTLKNGVPLDVLINAVQNNKISDKPNAERSHSSKHADITDHGGRKHRKKVRSFIDTSTQTATPQKTADAKLYYDDFHTIPRKPRVRSHTEDPKSSVHYIKAQDPYTSRHQHHQPRVEYHTHHEKKSGRRPSSEQPISKSNSESIPNWKSTAHTIHRTQSSDNAGPASFITGGKVKQRQGKSVNSIPSALYLTESAKIQKRNSAFVPVSRSTRESNPIGMEKGYYTVARGYDKYIYYDDVNSSAPNGNVTTASSYDPKNRHYHKGELHPHHHPHYHTEKPRRTNNTRFSDGHTYSLADQGRLSSFEDDDFSQKMSEACMRTLSAQRRKLSDSRFTHRMDSGRGSLRTDDSSSGLDVPNLEENHEYFGSPHTPANKQQPLQYDLLRTPFVESYNEVIV
uniref:uncharacterized protein LOC120325642 isoform X1 n=1 Tax=Styela clava TaxID=7725 RepID=UPI00193A7991|nr:uncharacterized protein LOC120325642 isoform X1 [Styela clava]